MNIADIIQKFSNKLTPVVKLMLEEPFKKTKLYNNATLDMIII